MNIYVKTLLMVLLSLSFFCGQALAQPDEEKVADPDAVAPPRHVPLPESLPPLENETLEMDIFQVLVRVTEESPTLEKVNSRIRQAQYRVEEAYTAVNPRAEFSAQYSRQEPPINLPNGVVINPADNYQFSLTLRQAIFTFGRLRWNVMANKLARRVVQEEYRLELNRLILMTAQRYIEALLSQEAVKIAQDNLEARQSQLRTSQLLFEQGVAAQFDVMRNSAAAAQAEQELLEARTAEAVAKARVLSLLDEPLSRPLRLEALYLAPPREVDLREAKSRALETRPGLRSLRWAVEEAKARIQVAETSNNPSFELQNRTVNQNATGFAPGTSNVTSLVLNVPLYDGGVSHFQAEQARESVKQLTSDLEKSERDVVLEIEEAYNRLFERYQAIEVAQENVRQAEEALRVAVLRYQNGISTNVELLDSQAARSQAVFGLAQANANYRLAQWNWWFATAAEYIAEVPLPPEIRQRLDEERLPVGPADGPLFGPPDKEQKLGPFLPSEPAPRLKIQGLETEDPGVEDQTPEPELPAGE